jgi:hypothetical protein
LTDRWLIAHKVSGEPAFDVATQVQCAECNPHYSERVHGCPECDDLGFWWIIPTSGHRAYPFYETELPEDFVCSVPDMPPGLPDHYPTSAAPSRPTLNLSALLPPPKIHRRF